jgi:hypothetical protein
MDTIDIVFCLLALYSVVMTLVVRFVIRVFRDKLATVRGSHGCGVHDADTVVQLERELREAKAAKCTIEGGLRVIAEDMILAQARAQSLAHANEELIHSNNALRESARVLAEQFVQEHELNEELLRELRAAGRR